MHPETPIMVKIGTNKLNSSYIGHVGDAIPLITLWEYLKVHTHLEMETPTHEVIDPGDCFSVYDITTGKYVQLLKIERFKPTVPIDWRIIHFDDGRHLFVTADTELDTGVPAVRTPVMHLCIGETITRDTRLWWKMDAWPPTWVRDDIEYGPERACVLGFTIPRIKANHYYKLTTKNGHITASGLDVLCEKES